MLLTPLCTPSWDFAKVIDFAVLVCAWLNTVKCDTDNIISIKIHSPEFTQPHIALIVPSGRKAWNLA